MRDALTFDEIVSELERASEAYYNGRQSHLSDAEWDALADTLRMLDPDHPVLKRVGSAVVTSASDPSKSVDGWAKIRHVVPMGSLAKAQTAPEMAEWANKAGGPFVGMHKFDGISIGCKWEQGQLVQAATRGDGDVGEDITRNVKLMKGVKHVIPGFDGHARGEILCLRSDFDAHFKDAGYSNPRNTAAGIAKRQSKPEACEHLTVVFYEVIPDEGMLPSKDAELEWLKAAGLRAAPYMILQDANAIEAVYQSFIEKERAALDYDIDGLVFAVADNARAQAMGVSSGRPNGAIAYKFPHATGETVLREVMAQVGKSGRITPVAVYDEVELAGAKCTRSTLHNWGRVVELGLRPGCRIVVSRRNDVIPGVEKNLDGGPAMPIPTHCPCCGFELEQEGAYLVCPNTIGCPAQRLGAIERWLDKVGILEWRTGVIEDLLDTGRVADVADLYDLAEREIASMTLDGRVVGGSAAPMVANLHARKELPLHVMVGALGIPLMGRSMCKVLVDAGFNTVDKMAAATVADLVAVHKMGDKKAKAFVSSFPKAHALIRKLGAAGVMPKAPVTGAMAGKSFCFTGVRSKELEAVIEAQGATVKGSVGKGLDFLVAKDVDTTSGKGKKAADLGVQVITLDAAWGLFGGRP